VRHRLGRHRCEGERQWESPAEERPRWVDGPDVGQDARDEPEAAPRGLVLHERDLVPRPAGDIIERRTGHPLPRDRLEIGQADDRGEVDRGQEIGHRRRA
jgi:hypothetical protein